MCTFSEICIVSRGKCMAAPRYEISLCVENISWVRAETKGNIIQHKKKDFVSPNEHVMFCLLFSQGIITCIIVERLSEDVRSRWQFLGQTLKTRTWQSYHSPDMGSCGKEKERLAKNIATYSGKGEVQSRVVVLEWGMSLSTRHELLES